MDMIKRSVFLVACLLCCVVTAQSIALNTSFDVSATYQTKRFKNGRVANDDTVAIIDLKYNIEGFYFGVTAVEDQLNLGEIISIDRNDFERFEYYLGYKTKLVMIDYIDSLTIDVGYMHTDYKRRRTLYTTDNELYLDLKTGLFLNPGIRFNYDFNHNYLTISPNISHSWQINEKWTLDNEFAIFWSNGKQMRRECGVKGNAFMAAYHKAELKYWFNDRMSLGPFIETLMALDGRVSDAYKEDKLSHRLNFLYGIKFDVEF